jgi:hypothetical protein
VRKQLVILRDTVRATLGIGDVLPPTAYSSCAGKARRELIWMGAGSLLGPCETARWSAVPSWTRLLADMPAIMKLARKEVQDAKRAAPGHPSNLKSTLFKSAEGRGAFFKKWM